MFCFTCFMVFTTHAITGAGIGILSGNPILAFIFGIISHFILDALPHFDQGGFYMKEDKGPAWLGANYDAGSKQKLHCARDIIMLAIDVIIAGILGIYLLIQLPSMWLFIILGGFGGIFIDLMDANPFVKDFFRKTGIGKILHSLHHFFHWPLSVKYWHIGILTQIAVIWLMFWIVL